MNLSAGDWVRCLRSGFWQISRILTYKSIDPIPQREHTVTTIIAKRFVSDSYKRSFSIEACSPGTVFPLDAEQRDQLELFISSNKSLYEKFCEYKETVDCIYNARIEIPAHEDSSRVAEKLSGMTPVRQIDIKKCLDEAGYPETDAVGWTIQFVSENFQIVGGYLMFEFSRVLEQ